MNGPTPFEMQSRQGFTLIEVLVSSVLTLVVLGLLFGILIGTLDAWESGTERLNVNSDARLVLDTMRTDLQSIIVRQTQYNQEWLYSSPAYLEDTDDNGTLEFIEGVPSDGLTRTWLTFFAPSLDRDTGEPGDMVGVSYLVALQDPISPGLTVTGRDLNIFGLYKAITTAQEAFVNALGYPASDPNVALLVANGGDPGYWSDTPDPLPEDPIGFIAPHVVKFAVTWLVSEPGVPGLRRFDETHTVRLSKSLSVVDVSSGLPGTPIVLAQGATIEAAEISLTMISEEAVERFKFFQNAAGGGAPTAAVAQLNRLIQEFGTNHTIRVPISY